jgi:hypothetical protein
MFPSFETLPTDPGQITEIAENYKTSGLFPSGQAATLNYIKIMKQSKLLHTNELKTESW